MSMPSPFELGAATGRGFSDAFSQYQDSNALDEILQHANTSQNPDEVIGEILKRIAPDRQEMALKIIQDKQTRINEENKLRQIAPSLVAKKNNQNQSSINNSPPIPGQGILDNQTQVQPSGGGFSDLTDDQLVQLSGLKGYSEPAKQELKRRQEDRTLQAKKEEGKIKRHTDLSQKTLEKASETASTIPQKKTALALMDDAIVNQDLSFWSKDNLAEITGIEGLRSPEGSIFKTAAKEYFLGNIQRAGARPNQWIEQQIQDMLTKLGRSTEANLSVNRALKNELALDEEKVRLTNEIADQLESELGYIPRDLDARVNKKLSVFAEDKQKELFNDLRAIKSIADKQTQKFMKVKEGTPVSKVVAQSLLKQFNNDPEKAAAEAKKLGYSF